MYNERMGRQKFYVVKELRAHPTTRRATMYLWLPEKDLETGLHKPCQIVADYKIRDCPRQPNDNLGFGPYL